MLCAPLLRGLHRFASEAATVELRKEHPTHFRYADERRLDLAHLLGITDFTDELSGFFFFDGPETVIQPGPVASVTKQASPDFFASARFAANVAKNGRIGPESDG
jgi:hypothetical protein